MIVVVVFFDLFHKKGTTVLSGVKERAILRDSGAKHLHYCENRNN